MTPDGEQGRRLPLWLAIVAALGLAALWAAMVSPGRSHAGAPRDPSSEGARRSVSVPGEARASARPALSDPSLVGRESGAPLPAPDPSATASVSGRVVDALGGPIAGAEVSAFRERSEALLVSTVTTESGGFELRAPPGAVRIVAEADAYSTALARVVAPASALTLALAPASRIFGRVRGTSDEPVAGAVVRARPLGRLEPLVPSALTDAAGRFRFEALSAGEYELSTTADRLSGNPEQVVARVADDVGPVELRVAPAARVVLEVERGGRACTAGWVNLSGDRFQGAREIAAGRVLFEGVPPGVYLLVLGCEATAVQSHELRVGVEDVKQTLHLDPGQALRGRVLDAAGTGVEGVLVTTAPAGEPSGRAHLTCRSGANGEFLCDGLSAGGYRCHAGLELQPQSEFVEVQLVAGAPAAPIELRLPSRAALVVSLDHAPRDRLSGVRVSARSERGPPLAGELRGSQFYFDGLLLGSYAVYLQASPGTRREVVLERAGQQVEVSLPWPTTRSISGVVLDERDQPAVEVWVRASAEGGLPFASLSEVGVPALTDSAGHFTVENLFEGRYDLSADGLERGGGAAGVLSGSNDVVIRLAVPRAVGEHADTDETGGADAPSPTTAPSRMVQRAPLGAPRTTKEEQP